MRIIEHEETKKTIPINELKKGEKSGFSKNFNRNSFRCELHNKYAKVMNYKINNKVKKDLEKFWLYNFET